MDTILFFLYLSVYLGVGGIIAELSLNYHDKEKLRVVTHRRAVYVIVTIIWPMCIVMFLHEFFSKSGGPR